MQSPPRSLFITQHCISHHCRHIFTPFFVCIFTFLARILYEYFLSLVILSYASFFNPLHLSFTLDIWYVCGNMNIYDVLAGINQVYENFNIPHHLYCSLTMQSIVKSIKNYCEWNHKNLKHFINFKNFKINCFMEFYLSMNFNYFRTSHLFCIILMLPFLAKKS